MIGKMVSLGFNLYTLPAGVAYRSTARLFNLPPTTDQLIEEIRASSEEVAREVQAVFDAVDREMSQKAAHLSPTQRQQAADLALSSAEQHLSMAAVNILRALWLASSANRTLARDEDPSIIDHES